MAVNTHGYRKRYPALASCPTHYQRASYGHHGYRKRYPAVSGGDAEGERECHCSNIGIENDTQSSMGSISAQTKRFTQPCGYRKRYPAVSGGDAEGERECHYSNIGIENDTQRSPVNPRKAP